MREMKKEIGCLVEQLEQVKIERDKKDKELVDYMEKMNIIFEEMRRQVKI